MRRVRLLAALRLGLVAGGLCALFIGPASLVAEPTLRITSPSSGTVFAPGQTLEITVEATPLAFRAVAVIGTLGFSQISRAAPYRLQIQIPADTTPGVQRLIAAGILQTAPLSILNRLRLPSSGLTVRLSWSLSAGSFLTSGTTGPFPSPGASPTDRPSVSHTLRLPGMYPTGLRWLP